jgi:hypothetical protein
MTGWHGALLGIALGLGASRNAIAQNEAPDAGEQGDCTPSREPHECADRCPSYDTCFIEAGDGQLYYRVENQRFDCDGLDCAAASVELGDYCCQRGDYAPSHGDGGGCAFSDSASSAAPGVGASAALALAFAATRLLRRAHRARLRPAAPGKDGGRQPS